MRYFTLMLALFVAPRDTSAQSLTTNLPIVVINSDQAIQDEPKVGATMKIIFNGEGQLNSYDDIDNPASLNYDGRIAIETRGSSSQLSPKKSYGFETRQADNISNRNVSLLGMPSENDWILNGLVFDPTLLHDYLAYSFSRNLGHYSARTVFCELFVNSDYRGVYMLQEKIKIDGDRVNLLEMSANDNAAPAVTGGYIIKADKTTGGDPVAFVMDGNHLNGYDETIDFVHDTPEPSSITGSQKTYIESIFRDLEAKAAANNASVSNGFPSVIDVPTFIDYMLVSELGGSIDAYKYSTYYHKDRNGKLRAGPVWDFNYGFGLVGGTPDWRSQPAFWQFENGNNEGPKFIRQLFYNQNYRCYLSRRWNQMSQPNAALNINQIHGTIDSMKSWLANAAARDNARWGTIGNFNDRINYLKQFVTDRSNWMTANIGPFGNCANPVLPQLVINEIMYNPPAGPFGSSNDQEFIEIKNIAGTAADLSGLYFAGLGLTYQFPAGSTLAANGLLVIASKSAVFASKYGKQAFGQFTRNLSNKSQKLTLSDAFGNIIDQVEYLDSAPWPATADGGGKSLELLNPSSDNTNGENWSVREANGGSPGVDNFGALPVRLASFSASAEGSQTRLSWTVTEETNFNRYVVEGSQDGKTFVKIGEVPGQGMEFYEFVDTIPFSGNNYYRLQCLDLDGTYAYSRIVSAFIQGNGGFDLFPNPTDSYLQVQWTSPAKATTSFDIYDINATGRLNDVKLDKNNSIDVSRLPPGIYVIRDTRNAGSRGKRFMIIR
ncbi:CotH kinase family protein [Dyadobacter sp. CY261]|uniref:CotH kinase family protein n=1 Tax=Dyadobacter sp. CY261 TaxID=2907203 RepID=UPI001F2A422C|nr:CotH kinase family protein [Dyadobacter sp. CY261]MCF0070064.1 CotH kinase family protein [Dyadobacter sp. CY261]